MLFAISFQSTIGSLAQGKTCSASNAVQAFCWIDRILRFVLIRGLPPESPARQLPALYSSCVGIETGYGFFAPEVPDNFKIVFELSFADGRKERVLPSIRSDAGSIRMVDLLDRVSQINYPPLLDLMMEMMVKSTVQHYRDVRQVRVICGRVILPSLEDYRHSGGEKYHAMFTYNFTLTPDPDTQ